MVTEKHTNALRPPKSIQSISSSVEWGPFAILDNPGIFTLEIAAIFSSFRDMNLDYQSLE